MNQDNEKKKEYLKRYILKVQAARDIEMEIEALRIEKMCPSIKIGDGMPQGSNITDLSNYMAALDNAIERLTKARYEKVVCYTEIFNQIELIENETEKRLLRLKYLKGLTWERICVEMGYEWTWIHHIHKEALRHFTIKSE